MVGRRRRRRRRRIWKIPGPKWRKEKEICVQVYQLDNLNSDWLRLQIPADIVRLRVESESSEGISRYVRHQHLHRFYGDDGCEADKWRFSEFPVFPEFNGPFPCDFTKMCSSVAVGSTIYCIGGDDKDIEGFSDIIQEKCASRSRRLHGNASASGVRHCCFRQGICHRVRYCDFGQKHPQWRVGATLISPRYSPKMVGSGGKLYVFGGNHPSEVVFGEEYDPFKGYWEPLPIPPFGRMCYADLVVASLNSSCGRKIVLYNKASGMLFSYDTINREWSQISLGVDAGDFHCSSMVDTLTVVDEHNTIYWINGLVTINAFDWKNLKHYSGPVVGLSHDFGFQNMEDYGIPLFHLDKDLFGALWMEDHDTTTLHLSILRVCKDTLSNDSITSEGLMGYLVGCVSYQFNFKFNVIQAHSLC